MTLSNILDQSNGHAPPDSDGAAPNGGGPARAHPLMLDSRPGNYDAYMGMVKSMVDREMHTLGNYISSGYYSAPALRSLVTRYYDLSLWQITSPAGLLNHRRTELIRERTNLHSILSGLRAPLDPDDVREMDEAEMEKLYRTSLTFGTATLDLFTGASWLVPLTLRECYARLDDITALVRSLSAQIQRSQRNRAWDCGPLIEYFRTPYKDRGEIDLMAIAPSFLRKLQTYIDVSIADVWRHQGQRIVSQTADGDDASSLQPNMEAAAPRKRSLLGRLTGR